MFARGAISVLVWCYALIAFAVQASAERRVALAIGNSAYKIGGVLANSVNDSKLVAAALGASKFEKIEVKEDLGISDFRQTLRRFQSQADGADVALIYFAGHGVEVSGTNWLVPVDAELRETRDLEYEAIKVDLALQALSGAKIRILVLDACRNNPFGRSWQAATRMVTRGLGRQEADGVLVLYAAAPGQVAADSVGTSKNSPFATAFARRLSETGLALQMLGGRVRDDVISATKDKQRPYIAASITGEPFYLLPSGNEKSLDNQQVEMLFWSSVKDSTSASVLRTYLDRYPNGEFASIARALTEHYDAQAKANVAAQEGERRRREEEKQQAEIRRLEEERRIRETELAEERARAKAAKSTEEVKRIESQERQEHMARLEELTKAQEEARLAREAAKKAEAERLAALKSAVDARKAAEAAIAAKKEAAKGTDVSKLSALPKLEKPPAKQPQARPDAMSYSLSIWAARSVRDGQTVSSETPYGTLTCTGGNYSTGKPRSCRWN